MASFGKRVLSREDLSTAGVDEKEFLLQNDSDNDEELFKRPSTSGANIRADKKIDSVKIQIHEVTDIMRDNVNKVIERGDRLENLQEASERLTLTGNEFRQSARKAHQKAWMQNLKSRILIIGATLTVVIFIIVLDIFALYLVVR